MPVNMEAPGTFGLVVVQRNKLLPAFLLLPVAMGQIKGVRGRDSSSRLGELPVEKLQNL